MKRVRVESVLSDERKEQAETHPNYGTTSSDIRSISYSMRTDNSSSDVHCDSHHHNQLIGQHLDWSDKQRRILTACDNADRYYTPERGFPFLTEELPHFYLQLQLADPSPQSPSQQSQCNNITENNVRSHDNNNDDSCFQSTYEAFETWQKQDYSIELPIMGIWKRPLFFGGFEHTTDPIDELVYNIQSNTLFIDIRIPVHTRNYLFGREGSRYKTTIRSTCDQNDPSVMIKSIDDMNIQQLRYYARQHIFAGYTRFFRTKNVANDDDGCRKNLAMDDTVVIATDESTQNNQRKVIGHPMKRFDQHCVRHHCIDWNYVGSGRIRPNKWWIELLKTTTSNVTSNDYWKEYSYSTDDYGQYYYMEHWERIREDIMHENYNADKPDTKEGIRLVLRMKPRKSNNGAMVDRDGIIILIDNHFNYCLSSGIKQLIHEKENHCTYHSVSSKVNLIDTALQHNDISTAKKWLGCIQGGYGYRYDDHHPHIHSSATKNGWNLKTCIEFWKEESLLWTNDEIKLLQPNPTSLSIKDCILLWNNMEWSIFEYRNIYSIQHLENILYCRGPCIDNTIAYQPGG
jgi:hypothetical protein